MMQMRLLLPLLAVLGALEGAKGQGSTSPKQGQTGSNATTDNFITDDFFKALSGPCTRFSDHLEACPSNPLKSSKDRFATAQLFADCLSRQYGSYFSCSKPFDKLKFLPVEAFPAMYNTKNFNDTWKDAELPNFPTNSSCSYPSVLPIMEKACAFDYKTLEGNDCCSSPEGEEPCGRESFNLLACSIQSLQTYVGCTAREADSDVEGCVVDTAPRINYVPIGFQVNSNGNECPEVHETIWALVRWPIAEFFMFLLANGPLLKRLRQRFFQHKRVPLTTKDFSVSILGFWTSLAIDIGEVVLVGTLLSKVGYQVDLFKEFVIWSVRPRSAFLNGVLGAIDGGWTHEALIDMVSHILLSIFGGYLALFGALTANHTMDPARPGFWKAYMAGGFMASISTDVVWLWFSIMCILATFCLWKAVLPSLVLVFKILWFAISASFGQAKVFVRNAYLTMRGRRHEREEYMVLSLESPPVKVWYYSALALCLVLFVGNWLFWVGFLKLSGELYCPGELSTLDMIIIGLSFARNLIRQMFRHL